MTKFWLLMFLALLGGVVGGYLLHRGSGDAPVPEVGGGNGRVDRSARRSEGDWLGGALEERSSDSLEDLLENKGSSRLPRMTLWLLEASSEEIGDLWRALKERDELDLKAYDVIMVHWVEIDPRGAIAAGKEADLERVAWWAWGRADPRVAMETALREAPEYAGNVLRSIGQFHVDLALELMEAHPEALMYTSVEGIGAGLRRIDPPRAVEFMRQAGLAGNDEMEAWVEQDPEAALAWVKKNLLSSSASSVDKFASELVIEFPGEVSAWLAEMPTGKLRRAVAVNYVRHLCETDLEQALTYSRAQTGLGVRNAMMAIVGERLVREDPGRSISLLEETMQAMPGVEALGVVDGSLTQADKLDAWAQRLIAVDPESLVVMAGTVSDGGKGKGEFQQSVMNKWMQWDEVAYAGWLVEQDAGETRDYGAEKLSGQLMEVSNHPLGQDQNFEAALGWANSIGQESRREAQLQRVVVQWMTVDPDGAATHFGAERTEGVGREIYEHSMGR